MIVSVDLAIGEKTNDNNKLGFYNNLDYDEIEISTLLENKLDLYVKKKNYYIIILIIIIIILIIALVTTLIVHFKSSEEKKECPSRCKCDKDGICIKCKNDYIFVEEDKTCLLNNYTFVARYSNEENFSSIQLINEKYINNIKEIRIEKNNKNKILNIEKNKEIALLKIEKNNNIIERRIKDDEIFHNYKDFIIKYDDLKKMKICMYILILMLKIILI